LLEFKHLSFDILNSTAVYVGLIWAAIFTHAQVSNKNGHPSTFN
jgi:hypothetical protein